MTRVFRNSGHIYIDFGSDIGIKYIKYEIDLLFSKEIVRRIHTTSDVARQKTFFRVISGTETHKMITENHPELFI